MTARLIALCFVAAAAGCKNPQYCAGNPNDDCRLMWDASVSRCMSSAECKAPLGVCDLMGTLTCVACTTSEPGACTGTTPVCTNNACQKCTAHTQCLASSVCLPDGSCANAIEVAYVQAGGTGSKPCDKATPCGTLDDGVTAGRPTVKVAAGMVTDTKVTIIDGKSLTIVADPGAKVTRSNPGVILQVQNDNANVGIYDLQITGGTGIGNPAISIPNGGAPKLSLTRVTVDGNQGLGISAATGTLTLSQSTVSSNTGGGISMAAGKLQVSQSTIRFNTGGGISISGAEFDLTNNFITSNGGVSSIFGGVRIDGIIASTGVHRLDFNTLTANIGPATINTGVACGTVLVPLVFSNNIVYANIVSGGGVQFGGSANCSATYSDVGPDTIAGTGNLNADPVFANIAQNNFHLQASSPARDKADTAATIAIDFDGDPRPNGTRSDIGADEWKP